jgi:hypothetical protein
MTNATAGSGTRGNRAKGTLDGEVSRQGDDEQTGMHGSERERGR